MNVVEIEEAISAFGRAAVQRDRASVRFPASLRQQGDDDQACARASRTSPISADNPERWLFVSLYSPRH